MRVAHSEGSCRSCSLQLHDSWRQTKQIVPLLLILIGGWVDAAVVDGLMQPPPAAAASPVADPVAAAAPADAPAAAAAALASSAASSALILAKSSSPLRNISNGCIGISCRWFDSSKFGSPVVVASAGMSAAMTLAMVDGLMQPMTVHAAVADNCD